MDTVQVVNVSFPASLRVFLLSELREGKQGSPWSRCWIVDTSLVLYPF